MRITRNSRRKPLGRIGTPAILFAVGGFIFAIAAEEVDEIRDLGGIVSVQTLTSHTTAAKVTHTLERAGKTYYVVSATHHLILPPSTSSRLLVMRKHSTALLVDSIDRMTEIPQVLPLPNGFTGKERSWYRGLTIRDGRVIPVINGDSFLTLAEQAIARNALGRNARAGVTA